MFSSTKFYLFLPNPKSSHLVALYFLYHYSFLLLLAASFWACYAGSSVFISPCPCILQPLHTLTSSEVFLFSSCFQSMLTICCSVYPLSLLCMSKLSQLCIFKFRVQRLYNNTEKHQQLVCTWWQCMMLASERVASVHPVTRQEEKYLLLISLVCLKLDVFSVQWLSDWCGVTDCTDTVTL